ncbi:MAG: hypothetical protein M0C28_41985 [Candidatus Moduliflexus flocculans]|nr:hypothetical protein [Candidatus Moduliflexus flocculans]
MAPRLPTDHDQRFYQGRASALSRDERDRPILRPDLDGDSRALFVIGLINGQGTSVGILEVSRLETEEIIKGGRGLAFSKFYLTADRTKFLFDTPSGINVMENVEARGGHRDSI